MVAFKTIIIVTEAPILEPIIKGGAQRVLYDTYRALMQYSEKCIVYHHVPNTYGTTINYTCASLSDEGRIQYHLLSHNLLLDMLGNADLIISVDKYFAALAQGKHNVLSLSNLAYDTEKEAVRKFAWERIWVMSPYLRDKLIQEFGVSKKYIDIVQPTFPSKTRKRFVFLKRISEQLENDGIPLERRLLFPHRSDPEKGLESVIDLLRILARDDKRWRLLLTSPGMYDDQNNKEYFWKVVRSSNDIKNNLCIIPWQPYQAMAHLFKMSGCTIMASKLPESFGLSAAESIVCGTPVITLESGALSKRYFNNPPIYYFVSEISTIETANLVREVCGTRVSREIINSMEREFSFESHAQAVCLALKNLNGETKNEHA